MRSSLGKGKGDFAERRCERKTKERGPGEGTVYLQEMRSKHGADESQTLGTSEIAQCGRQSDAQRGGRESVSSKNLEKESPRGKQPLRKTTPLKKGISTSV